MKTIKYYISKLEKLLSGLRDLGAGSGKLHRILRGMIKFSSFIKNHKILIFILILGSFLRMYNAREYLSFGYDQDVASWFTFDVLKNHHLRLVGQETTTLGIFIGPLYYYLLTFYYFIFNMSPFGGIYLNLFLGVFSIWSFYYIFLKIFEKQNLAEMAAFIYAISFSLVSNDRLSNPTTPMILWGIWYLYSLYLLLKKSKKAPILIGLLIGLIWHINFSLLIPLVLIPVTLKLRTKKLDYKEVNNLIISTFLFTFPFWLFELRHGFIQVKSFVDAFLLIQISPVSIGIHFGKVYNMFNQIVTTLVIYPKSRYYFVLPLLLMLYLLYLIRKKMIDKNLGIILFIWPLPFILFFSLYTKQVSENYLNGSLVVFILLITFLFHKLLTNINLRLYGLIIFIVFFVSNIKHVISIPYPLNGYQQKTLLLQFIKSDAQVRGYPCVSISFISEPGTNFGYRYLYYLNNLRVNNPKRGSPVYTIVYPINDSLYPSNRAFGSIGLIYPDYDRYNIKDVERTCQGTDDNMLEPILGLPM